MRISAVGLRAWTLLALVATSVACGSSSDNANPVPGPGDSGAPGSDTSPLGETGDETNDTGEDSPATTHTTKDPTPEPDGGNIIAMKVTDARGKVQPQYASEHPILFTITMQPTLAEHNDWIHVGLVEKHDASASSHDGIATCEIGSFQAHYGKEKPEGTTFTQRFYIPKECLADASSKTFNLWVALNPPQVEKPDEATMVAVKDEHTQYFDAAMEDITGKDRNKLCKGPDGAAGCVIDIPIVPAPGLDFELLGVELSSKIGVIEEGCKVDAEMPLLTNVGTFVGFGAPMVADDNAEDPKTTNLLEGKLKTGEAVAIKYEICPAKSGTECADGTTYAPLGILASDDPKLETLKAADDFTELTATNEEEFTHDVFVDPAGQTCARVFGKDFGGAKTEDWSKYAEFNVRICVAPPFAEAGNGSSAELASDDCKIVPMRIERGAGAVHEGAANSYDFSKEWSKTLGNDKANLTLAAGTTNVVDVNGATSNSYAKATVGGWLSTQVLNAWGSGAAYVAVVGSGVDAGLEIFGSKVWGYTNRVPEQTWTDEQKISKRQCAGYNYGIAGIGFNLSACATGNLGITNSLTVSSKDGAGPAPFDASTKIGQIVATVTPSVDAQFTAEASVNVLIAKGGVTGTVNLLKISAPVTATLNWGLTSVAPPTLAVTGNVAVNVNIDALSGTLNAWVDLLKPAWCSCGKWCPGYPCVQWPRVWDQAIASWDGYKESQQIYTFTSPTLTIP